MEIPIKIEEDEGFTEPRTKTAHCFVSVLVGVLCFEVFFPSNYYNLKNRNKQIM